MITRMIFVKVAPEQVKEAIDDWKKVCAPLMISQAGCHFGGVARMPRES